MFKIDHLRTVLNDIIDLAYQFEPDAQVKTYKKFEIFYDKKDTSTVSGRYGYSDNSLHLYNMYSGNVTMKKTVRAALHELAHHIDWVENSHTGHQASFYHAYTDLIYAALDMRILTPNDFKSIWMPDGNKVNTQIVEMWRPRYVEYQVQLGSDNTYSNALKGSELGQNAREATARSA